MTRWHLLLISGILVIYLNTMISLGDRECCNITSLPKASPDEEKFKGWISDNNNQLLDIYQLSRNNIGENCAILQINNTIDNYKFFWMKEGGDYTNLTFYINDEFRGEYNGEGFFPSNFDLKKGDKLEWKLTVRDSTAKGIAWIAIPSFKYMSIVPSYESSAEDTPVENPVESLTAGEISLDHVIEYRKVYVEDSDLQDVIDRCMVPTDVILNKRSYDIKNSIKIENKNFIHIHSSFGYSTINGNDIEIAFIVNNSSFVKIERMDLENFDNGIEINNSNNCSIKDNQIKFGCYGDGILINSSDSVEILDNLIWNSSKQVIPDTWSVGIKIENSSNIYINKNEITCDNNRLNLLIAYYVSDDYSVNNITIIPKFNPESELKILYGTCLASWTYSDDIHGENDSSGNPCRLPDHSEETKVWCIKWEK